MIKPLYIAAILAVALPIASFAFTPSNPIQGEVTPFLPVESDGTVSGNAAPLQAYTSAVSSLTAQGATYGCEGEGAAGGSLSNALNSNVQDLLGQGGNALRGRLRELTSKLGPLGGVLDKVADRAISQGVDYLSKGAQDLLKGLGIDGLGGVLGGAGGGVGGVVGSVLGGDVGGVVGAVTGGGLSVPVAVTSDVNTTSFKNTERTNAAIDAQTRALFIKECYTDPAVRRVNAAISDQTTRSAGDFLNGKSDGYTKYFQGWEPRAVNDALVEKIVTEQLPAICSPYEQEIQQFVLTDYQRTTDVGADVACTVDESGLAQFVEGAPSANALDNLLTMSLSNEGLAKPLVAKTNTAKQLAAKQAEIERMRATGFKDITDCPVEKVGGICPTLAPTVWVPAVLNQELAKSTIITQPAQQLVAADEIGEMINELTATLAQQAFQGLGGLLSLSKKSKTQSGSGSYLDGVAGEGGSYLDELVGGSNDSSVDTGRDAMLSDMKGTLGIAEDYLDVLDAIERNLIRTKKSYQSVNACYVKLASTISTKISTDTALTRANEASTTVKNILDPELKRISELMLDTKDAIARLEAVIDETQAAQTTADLGEASARYQGLKGEGILYTTSQLTALQNELAAGALALKVLDVDASDKLRECNAL